MKLFGSQVSSARYEQSTINADKPPSPVSGTVFALQARTPAAVNAAPRCPQLDHRMKDSVTDPDSVRRVETINRSTADVNTKTLSTQVSNKVTENFQQGVRLLDELIFYGFYSRF